MGIDDAPRTLAGFNNSANIYTTFAAKQKVGCPESELITLHFAGINGTEPKFTRRV
jgi:hypothetical protein